MCFCTAFINKLLCSFGLDIEFRIQDLSKILCWVGEWHSSRWRQKYIEVRGSPSAFGKKLEAEKLAIEIRENDVCKIWTGIFPRSSFIYGDAHSKVPGRKVHPQMKNMSLQKKKKANLGLYRQTWKKNSQDIVLLFNTSINVVIRVLWPQCVKTNLTNLGIKTQTWILLYSENIFEGITRNSTGLPLENWYCREVKRAFAF